MTRSARFCLVIVTSQGIRKCLLCTRDNEQRPDCFKLPHSVQFNKKKTQQPRAIWHSSSLVQILCSSELNFLSDHTDWYSDALKETFKQLLNTDIMTHRPFRHLLITCVYSVVHALSLDPCRPTEQAQRSDGLTRKNPPQNK